MNDSPPAPVGSSPMSLSRRTALLSTVGLGLGLLATRTAVAQSATPMASEMSYLFVLAGFTSGTFEENGDGTYTILLAGVPDHMVFFADRPGREVGTIPVERGLEILGLDGDNPPNAALVLALSDGTTDTVVLELTGFTLDAVTDSLSLQVTVLGAEALGGEGLSFAEAPLAPEMIPAEFDASSLFIDSLTGCSPWDPRC